MNKKKLMMPLLAAGLVAGAAAGYAGLASAQTSAAATTGMGIVPASGVPPSGGFRGGPHVDGTVTAVSGNIVTVTEEANEGGTVYSVDTSGATITKDGAASTLSAVAVGDHVFARGTVNGKNVTASRLYDGKGPGGPGMARGGFGGPGMGGTVTAINGTTLTVSGGMNGVAVFTVDASKATVTKSGATADLSGIAVGDKIFVRGTITTATVTATGLIEGQPTAASAQ